MAYDQNFFVGLTREPDRSDSHSEIRSYGMGQEHVDTPMVGVGTHHCAPVQTVFPFLPQPIDCPSEGHLDIVTTVDLTTGKFVRFGLYPEDLSLAERILQMPPYPAYVQIFVDAEFSTRGGNNDCLTEVFVIGSCPDPVDGFLTKGASSPTATFEFGGIATSGVEHRGPVPFGFIDDSTIAGLLRRPIDALSYTGDPGNEAANTLIPWSEFIANPTATVEAHADHVNVMWQHTSGFSVTLWWLLARPRPVMCVVDSA